MKKIYYYKVVEKKPRSAGGYNVTAEVFEVKSGKISKIGSLKWNTSGYKGDQSSVYDFLYGKKLITAKEYKENNGYWYVAKSKVSIQSL
jgi:hypothetical protein